MAMTEEMCTGTWREAGLEPGVSGRSTVGMGRRRPTFRELGSLSPRPTSLLEVEVEDPQHHHFLDECFLCKKHIRRDSDIYMYKGDTPFCSEECREEQMELDEVRERSRLAFRASARKERLRIKANGAGATRHSNPVRAISAVGAV